MNTAKELLIKYTNVRGSFPHLTRNKSGEVYSSYKRPHRIDDSGDWELGVNVWLGTCSISEYNLLYHLRYVETVNYLKSLGKHYFLKESAVLKERPKAWWRE